MCNKSIEYSIICGDTMNKKINNLIKAIKKSDITAVSRLTNLNHIDHQMGCNALIVAVKHGNLEIVKALVEAAIKRKTIQSHLEHVSEDHETALLAAYNHPWIASYLIKVSVKAGVDLNQKDRDGNTVLMRAVSSIIETNDESHYPPYLPFEIPNTIDRNHEKSLIVSCLCRYGANINSQNKMGQIALDTAIDKKYIDVIAILLRYYTEFNLPILNLDKHLIQSAKLGLIDILSCLLEYEFNRDGNENYAAKAIIEAASNGLIDHLDYLLGCYPDDNSLHQDYSCIDNHLDVEDLTQQYSKRAKDIYLLYTTCNERKDVAQNLMKHTPTYMSEKVVNFRIVQLINKRFHINARDKQGDTALIAATRCEQEDTVSHLLKLGADTNIVNHSNKSALHVAAEIGNDKIIALLLDYNAE